MSGLVDRKETERKGTPISRWHAAATRINPDDEHVIGDQLDAWNARWGLLQFSNGSATRPQPIAPPPPAYPP